MFVSMAFGSKGKKYSGQDMFKVHEAMIREQGLGLAHFDAVAGHLVAAMKQLNVPQPLIDEAAAIVMTLRPVFDPAQNGTGEAPDSLYTRIGGAAAVQATVDVFYKKVLADPLLSPFFEGIDMVKQRNKQVRPLATQIGR
jgi:truncated hemoglobin YjbI